MLDPDYLGDDSSDGGEELESVQSGEHRRHRNEAGDIERRLSRE